MSAILNVPPLLLLAVVVLVLTSATGLMLTWPDIEARRIGEMADQVRWEAEIEARADRPTEMRGRTK
jgi:hypothetical protein